VPGVLQQSPSAVLQSVNPLVEPQDDSACNVYFAIDSDSEDRSSGLGDDGGSHAAAVDDDGDDDDDDEDASGRLRNGDDDDDASDTDADTHTHHDGDSTGSAGKHANSHVTGTRHARFATLRKAHSRLDFERSQVDPLQTRVKSPARAGASSTRDVKSADYLNTTVTGDGSASIRKAVDQDRERDLLAADCVESVRLVCHEYAPVMAAAPLGARDSIHSFRHSLFDLIGQAPVTQPGAGVVRPDGKARARVAPSAKRLSLVTPRTRYDLLRHTIQTRCAVPVSPSSAVGARSYDSPAKLLGAHAQHTRSDGAIGLQANGGKWPSILPRQKSLTRVTAGFDEQKTLADPSKKPSPGVEVRARRQSVVAGKDDLAAEAKVRSQARLRLLPPLGSPVSAFVDHENDEKHSLFTSMSKSKACFRVPKDAGLERRKRQHGLNMAGAGALTSHEVLDEDTADSDEHARRNPHGDHDSSANQSAVFKGASPLHLSKRSLEEDQELQGRTPHAWIGVDEREMLICLTNV